MFESYSSGVHVPFDACAFAQLHSGKQTGDAVEEDAAVARLSACLVIVMTTAAH